ncbi:2-oxoglutarate dehydrogenase E1 component [Aureliella helgolandensis]|uniref:oxoglutarate dehydrogenase (succinyl-transferring) n=1 Tax=Aureliella helgolandensis TaxID=2527968 RepID=A0A518G659_9BACT|nr:2-oxoglutarate dehydrogenase E1 component [Aureliella helgolandensis]QDV24078.1 2-oxoglutarate dehydrogenase E1 component [Aureliella helgolandensis]
MNSYSLDYIDDLYVQYIRDPSSVSPGWRKYFEEFSLANATASGASEQSGLQATTAGGSVAVAGDEPNAQARSIRDEALWLAQMQDRVDNLVREYRVRGHLMAKLDPLKLANLGNPELEPGAYGLSEEDMARPFSCPNLQYVDGRTLGDIVTKLQNTYCRSIGAQFMHIDNRTIRDWLQRRMESCENRLELSREVQCRIYSRLTDAAIFEEFVRRKFVGAKTFSLEGAESLIPLLDLSLEKAGQHGVEGVLLAMAHRGRLNVLANIMGKRAQSIFWSFDDPRPDMHRGAGDVRYHLGYSSDWATSTGAKVHISLCFNPSHLEYVNTVAQGRCRAKQDRSGDDRHSKFMTILVHGDAAFAGEGIVQETLNMSELPGYKTGGTLHVILNNQVGFTTEPDESRSCTYATDVAKMLQIPIFHVNGEDPEAVAQVVNLAMDFRREFRRDVVIDMYAYRKWGHNEGDEPRFTQPLMYKTIDERKSVRESYLKRLLKLGEITRQEADAIAEVRQTKLEREFELAQKEEFIDDLQTLGGSWQGYYGGDEPLDDLPDTMISDSRARALMGKLAAYPKDFQINRKLKRFMELRGEMAEGKRGLDWSAGEALALASMLVEGHPVRFSGQDCERGTFSQRHSVLHDTVDNTKHMPLNNLSADQARVDIINSPLCEAGVLGFEYGYSLDCPEGVVIWEAQFGDFWNVAQVIVDQFITSAEDKWGRLSHITLLLPHGFEGAGPEHCSARLERFLLLTAEDNIQVTQPSTPAQYFHLLRRQAKRRWSKPLVVLTPKSLLRHPEVVSQLEDFTTGKFEKILPDTRQAPPQTDRILLCSGKVYYELAEKRKAIGADNVAIVRIEQYYPLKEETLAEALQPYQPGTDLVWVQEEPTNMGAWQFMKVKFGDMLADLNFKLRRISRVESASPSTGSASAHKLEQDDLIEEAFANL